MRVFRLNNAALALSLIATAGFAGLTSAPVAIAQSQISGDIAGTVTDPSGAVVPNAQITVTNTQTGVTKTATSNGNGAYRVALLPAGTYKISVTAAGFQTSTLTLTVT